MAMEAAKAKNKKVKGAFKKPGKHGEKTRFLDDPKKRKITGIVILIIGIVMLIAGTAFLVINATKKVAIDEGEYLISAGNWSLEGEEGVTWDFTEMGKGTLTTNNHQNDYAFKWLLKDGKLLVKTDWLYELDNEYEYELDQSAGTLTLTEDGKEYRFKAN